MPPLEHQPSFDHVIQIEDKSIDVSEFQVPIDEISLLTGRVLSHLEEDGVREEYNESDIHWLLESKPYNIERFAMSARVLKVDGLKLIQKCLLWRKKTDMSRLTDECFPAEFYEKRGLFRWKQDKKGTPLLYMRIRMVKRSPDIDQLLKLFLAYQVSKIDDSRNSLMGWAVVFDCSDIGFANVHFDMMKFLIDLLKDYFPAGVRYVLVYDLPWLLNKIKTLFLSWIPEEAKKQIFFKGKKDIMEMIDEDCLPDYMKDKPKQGDAHDDGETDDQNNTLMPKRCLPFRQLYAGKYTEKEFERIQKYLSAIQ